MLYRARVVQPRSGNNTKPGKTVMYSVWAVVWCVLSHPTQTHTHSLLRSHLLAKANTSAVTNQPQTLLHIEKHARTAASKGEQEENKGATEVHKLLHIKH